MNVKNIIYKTDLIKANRGALFVPVVNNELFYDKASNDSRGALRMAQELALGLAESYSAHGFRVNVTQEIPTA